MGWLTETHGGEFEPCVYKLEAGDKKVTFGEPRIRKELKNGKPYQIEWEGKTSEQKGLTDHFIYPGQIITIRNARGKILYKRDE